MKRARAATVGGMIGATLLAAPALALEPLPVFLAAARQQSSATQERQALAVQSKAELNTTRFMFLPAVSVELGYTRNQLGVTSIFPTGTPGADGTTVGTTRATFVARDQLDANVGVRMPLFDVTLFRQREARSKRWQAAQGEVRVSENEVAQSVVRAYYEYIAAAAMVDAARAAEKVAMVDAELMRVRVVAGTAAEIDGKRAAAELLSCRQAVAEAELVRQEARRVLRTLSGLTASGELPVLDASPAAEPPLPQWLSSAGEAPAVLAAQHATAAAESAAAPLWYVALPTLEAQFRERVTNAPGFLPKAFWSLGATASWNLDMARFPTLRASAAGAEAARARLQSTRDESRNAIERAWQQVEALRLRVEAAQAQAETTAAVQRIAQADYQAGRVAALRLIEASRDAFRGEVERLRAIAELHMWRALLRICSGRAPEGAS